MTTDNTETILTIAGRLLGEKKEAPKKKLKSRHWLRIEAAIENAAKGYKCPVRLPIDDSDLARFALEMGPQNLVGLQKRIGKKFAARLIAEAIEFLDEAK
jgi:hypothetical protein